MPKLIEQRGLNFILSIIFNFSKNFLTFGVIPLLLEKFGQILISEVRDPALHVAMMVAKFTTPNQIDKENYAVLSTLSEQQQEKVCDLLSLTITDTIYRILEMIEE